MLKHHTLLPEHLDLAAKFSTPGQGRILRGALVSLSAFNCSRFSWSMESRPLRHQPQLLTGPHHVCGWSSGRHAIRRCVGRQTCFRSPGHAPRPCRACTGLFHRGRSASAVVFCMIGGILPGALEMVLRDQAQPPSSGPVLTQFATGIEIFGTAAGRRSTVFSRIEPAAHRRSRLKLRLVVAPGSDLWRYHRQGPRARLRPTRSGQACCPMQLQNTCLTLLNDSCHDRPSSSSGGC